MKTKLLAILLLSTATMWAQRDIWTDNRIHAIPLPISNGAMGKSPSAEMMVEAGVNPYTFGSPEWKEAQDKILTKLTDHDKAMLGDPHIDDRFLSTPKLDIDPGFAVPYDGFSHTYATYTTSPPLLEAGNSTMTYSSTVIAFDASCYVTGNICFSLGTDKGSITLRPDGTWDLQGHTTQEALDIFWKAIQLEGYHREADLKAQIAKLEAENAKLRVDVNIANNTIESTIKSLKAILNTK